MLRRLGLVAVLRILEPNWICVNGWFCIVAHGVATLVKVTNSASSWYYHSVDSHQAENNESSSGEADKHDGELTLLVQTRYKGISKRMTVLAEMVRQHGLSNRKTKSV
ncbi:hypothetical protein F4604DRAFT_1736502 [Suillus subluteus]|nr:hypothetical protein F4604DRAFT_1736502 [Suillus subluteus]